MFQNTYEVYFQIKAKSNYSWGGKQSLEIHEEPFTKTCPGWLSHR
jgi:hypothetical protein